MTENTDDTINLTQSLQKLEGDTGTADVSQEGPSIKNEVNINKNDESIDISETPF